MPRRYGVFRAAVNRRRLLAVVAAGVLAGPAVAQGGGAGRLRLSMLGDSLTAGYGVKSSESLPVQLERRLQAGGLDIAVANHGVSGDTSEGGLQRLDWMLADSPDIVIVALGANDALRGLDPALTERNLDRILERLRERAIVAMLAGMLAPRNYGAQYAAAFDGLYPRLAERHAVPLYPFLLQGVALEAALNQPDGIHPNPRGVEVIADRLAPFVAAAIAAAGPVLERRRR